MFWRSVVGKLWFTIILLMSFILAILTILLLQLFESYHVKQAENELSNLAYKIAGVIEHYDDKKRALLTAWEIVDANSTRIVVAPEKGKGWISPNTQADNQIPVSVFEKDKDLMNVVDHKKTVRKQATYLIEQGGKEKQYKLLIVGVPMELFKGKNGAVFVYQSLDVVQKTINYAKKIILLCAGIAIVMTTVFAFFLSSRITAPLRKMREAATQLAEGQFTTNVPILTRDEIGELAIAFNRMGRQLKNYILALNQEKEQLSSILSSMADGVITFNVTGNILITNPPADEFIQSWLFETDDKKQIVPRQMKDLFCLVVESQKEQMTEIEVQGRHWVIVMTPLRNQKAIRGAVAVLRDMTEERKLDKLRKDFIANVSHELRTPIAMLQGYSEAIVDDIAETEEEKKEIAQIILDESKRMGRLVNELLDLARVESGKIELLKQQTEIQPFIERIIRKFQGIAKDHDVTLDYEFLSKETKILMDTDKIEQVLTNLIDNAIRHTYNDGSVFVSVSSSEREVIFDVQDTGSGISKEDLPFVFERFYKADKARTRGRSGTGLGLAIAKNIVKAHRGHIYVKSKLGEGTTFTFSLPRQINEHD